jgi:mercuric ion transport protein
MHSAAMSINDENSTGDSTRGQALLATGGLLGALAASSCCIAPLILFSLGVSGAWIGSLTRLAPYQPILIAATLACLGAGAWLLRRASNQACGEAQACARPLPLRLVKAALIVAALLIIAALGFDLLAPMLLS